MASRFVINPNFEGELLHSTWLRDQLEPVADAAKRNAVNIAPKRTEHYVDSIEAEVGVSPAHDSLIVHLYATDFKAWWVEAGTANTDASPTLVPAMEQAAPGARWGAIA